MILIADHGKRASRMNDAGCLSPLYDQRAGDSGWHTPIRYWQRSDPIFKLFEGPPTESDCVLGPFALYPLNDLDGFQCQIICLFGGVNERLEEEIAERMATHIRCFRSANQYRQTSGLSG